MLGLNHSGMNWDYTAQNSSIVLLASGLLSIQMLKPLYSKLYSLSLIVRRRALCSAFIPKRRSVCLAWGRSLFLATKVIVGNIAPDQPLTL